MPAKLILALDTKNPKEAINIVDEFHPLVKYFKVGSVLYALLGNKIIEYIQSRNANVFLDLKFFDIPNTVKEASFVATKLGVKMFTIHLLGGKEMIRASLEGIKEEIGKNNNKTMPLLLGVTILTSFNEKILRDELKINLSLKDMVLHLATMGYKEGIRGFVCSPEEIRLIKNNLGEKITVVTPGIRIKGDSSNDQKRILTPGDASLLGTDYIVVGRSVLNKTDRVRAVEEILKEINTTPVKA